MLACLISPVNYALSTNEQNNYQIEQNERKWKNAEK